jgi:carbonic anhydrase
MPRHLIEGLHRFHRDTFPRYREQYRRLIEEGQRPSTLFIGCSDSRVVPDLLMGTDPGQLFIIRNMGAFVPPYDPSQGYHGTSATIEYAVLVLGVTDIVVCGHSHCGAVRATYDPPSRDTPHIQRWLELGQEARVPEEERAEGLTPEVLRRTEQRAVALQLERLLGYPLVRERVDAGTLALHGWHYMMEDGQVLALDVERETFTSLTPEAPSPR